MAQGKILIVNKTNGSIFGWFGETSNDSRPTIDNITLVELEPYQYSDNFINCPIEYITVTDIANKVLTFNPPPVISQPTYEQLQQELLQAQGVI